MVIPVGGYFQELLFTEKLPDGRVRESKVASVAFVPMTGEAQRRRDLPHEVSRSNFIRGGEKCPGVLLKFVQCQSETS